MVINKTVATILGAISAIALAYYLGYTSGSDAQLVKLTQSIEEANKDADNASERARLALIQLEKEKQSIKVEYKEKLVEVIRYEQKKCPSTGDVVIDDDWVLQFNNFIQDSTGRVEHAD